MKSSLLLFGLLRTTQLSILYSWLFLVLYLKCCENLVQVIELVLILQYVKSLIFESVCLACIVCLVLCHLLPQAISAFPWEGKWYHSCFITFHFFLWEQCRMKAWVAVERIHVVLSSGESSQIPFVFCFPVHHKELLLKQPGTLLSLRLESNPIWEDLPCYLAERQDSNGIISYDMLMPASDLDFSFLVFF